MVLIFYFYGKLWATPEQKLNPNGNVHQENYFIMRKLLASVFMLTIATFASAQQSGKVIHVVKGKVINSESNQPVSYTNIGIDGTLFGTASDENGNFELKIPEDFTSKNIYFSAVGFQYRQFPVSELFGKQFNLIKLNAQSYDVEKVDVEAQNLVLIRILRMASENIRYNYGAGPFNLHCDLTIEKTINDTIHKNIDAKVLVYDAKGYSNPSILDAYKSRNYRITKTAGEEDYTFSTAQLGIDELLGLDWVRSASGVLNPGLLREYTLNLKDQPNIDGKEYWVIGFKQYSPTPEGSGDFYASSFQAEITINKADYSVRSIRGRVASPKNSPIDRSLAVSNENSDFLVDVNYEFNVEYRNLLIHDFSLSKSYTYKGKNVRKTAKMTVTRAHANNVTQIGSRDYFPAE